MWIHVAQESKHHGVDLCFQETEQRGMDSWFRREAAVELFHVVYEVKHCGVDLCCSEDRRAWTGLVWIKRETTVEWIYVVQESNHCVADSCCSKEGPVLNIVAS
jgi:hypothetical protein